MNCHGPDAPVNPSHLHDHPIAVCCVRSLTHRALRAFGQCGRNGQTLERIIFRASREGIREPESWAGDQRTSADPNHHSCCLA